MSGHNVLVLTHGWVQMSSLRVWETRMWTCERWPCVKGRCQVNSRHRVPTSPRNPFVRISKTRMLFCGCGCSRAVGVQMGADFSSPSRERWSSTSWPSALHQVIRLTPCIKQRAVRQSVEPRRYLMCSVNGFLVKSDEKVNRYGMWLW